VLTSFAINDQFANLERLLLSSFRMDLHSSPLSPNDRMALENSKAAAAEQQKADEYT
jgi:hypothetical protein